MVGSGCAEKFKVVKDLPGRNALAYFSSPSVTKKKKVLTFRLDRLTVVDGFGKTKM